MHSLNATAPSQRVKLPHHNRFWLMFPHAHTCSSTYPTSSLLSSVVLRHDRSCAPIDGTYLHRQQLVGRGRRTERVAGCDWRGVQGGARGEMRAHEPYSFLLRALRPPLDLERAVVKTLREVEGRDIVGERRRTMNWKVCHGWWG